ncbi:MAG TPA: MFS transporter [Opitutaceae bacterium]|nr:MFS transporter [Opitutaceae bacterium]
MYLSFVALCLIATIVIYFLNNPIKHGTWFMVRRFINWFPLGMTYAFLYMGRYNLVVAKNALGTTMSNEDFGWIFFWGTAVYAFAFLVNGPLVDKIGGKRGIIIAAVGAAAANIGLGVLTYLVALHRLQVNLVVAFSVLYALNMYFQSYGAVSIIKVKAYWFHVRERGVFGAIFGTLISFGVYFAFDWGQAIVEMTKAHPGGPDGWFQQLLQRVFALKAQPVDATWAVFYLPAVILLFWVVLDWWLIKDTPEEAHFAAFDTHDASSGHMDEELTVWDLLKRVLFSPLILLLALANLTSGVLRNGVTQWYFIYGNQIKQPGGEFFVAHWGLLLCLFGIVGGFAGGLVSDKFFQSRRGPPTGLFCIFALVMAVVMAAALRTSPFLVGLAGVCIVMAAVGITSLMAGTAATDLGGRKATATCSGIVDGSAYLGSALQSVSLGYLTGLSWLWWPIFLMPFAALGIVIAVKIWTALPPATRKYVAEVEHKHIAGVTP